MHQKSTECSGRAFWKTPSRVPSGYPSGESLVCDRAAQFKVPGWTHLVKQCAAESSQRRFSRLPAHSARCSTSCSAACHGQRPRDVATPPTTSMWPARKPQGPRGQRHAAERGGATAS